MHEWFGRIPKFIITPAADYCEQCNDLGVLRTGEHELYHIAQATDDQARRSSTKRPGCRCSNFAAMTSRSSRVRRYGASKDVQEMVMRRTGRRRLLISMLPERAGRMLKLA